MTEPPYGQGGQASYKSIHNFAHSLEYICANCGHEQQSRTSFLHVLTFPLLNLRAHVSTGP